MNNGYIGVRRNGLTILLFTLITCGIYAIYWYYVAMEDINKASGEMRINSVAWLLGSLLCPPLSWVILYKLDNELIRLSRENGTVYNGNFILWLLLTFACGIGTLIAIFQIPTAFNDIWDRRQNVVPYQ